MNAENLPCVHVHTQTHTDVVNASLILSFSLSFASRRNTMRRAEERKLIKVKCFSRRCQFLFFSFPCPFVSWRKKKEKTLSHAEELNYFIRLVLPYVMPCRLWLMTFSGMDYLIKLSLSVVGRAQLPCSYQTEYDTKLELFLCVCVYWSAEINIRQVNVLFGRLVLNIVTLVTHKNISCFYTSVKKQQQQHLWKSFSEALLTKNNNNNKEATE